MRMPLTGLSRDPWRLVSIVLIVSAALVAFAFVLTDALPYFALDRERFGRAPDVFWPRRHELLLHIAGGTIALLAGPVQLYLGITGRHWRWHRHVGRAYLLGVALGSAAAFQLALTTPVPAGPAYPAGLFMLGVAWVLTTSLAYVSIRLRQVDQHREWMVRSYVVTFAFVTFRITWAAMDAFDVGIRFERLAFAAWSCWSVPLLAAEACLQGRKLRRLSGASRRTSETTHSQGE